MRKISHRLEIEGKPACGPPPTISSIINYYVVGSWKMEDISKAFYGCWWISLNL